MDEVAKYALAIYDAFEAIEEGDIFLPVAKELNKYLEYIGYDRSKTKFEIHGDVSFSSGRRSMHITVVAPKKGELTVEFTSYLADDYYPPRDGSEEERFRQASRLLLGINYAIDHCLQKLVNMLVFGGATEEHRNKAFTALHTMASESE